MGFIKDRLTQLKHAWNAFIDLSVEDRTRSYGGGYGYGARPDRTRLTYSTDRSIFASILTRMTVDASSVDIRHVRLDDEERYLEDIDSGLNECLKVQPNLDQGPSHLKRDIFSSMFDKGCIAVVPVETTENPIRTGGFDIKNLRVGEIISWHPSHVGLSVYNEKTGAREQITLPKNFVAIVENPFYNVMNEPNSTLQRLIRKLNLLDSVDEAAASGKLDLIIHLPYGVRSEVRRQQAEQRRVDVEAQLKGSKYGIAYMDGTEKITQLNRPAENNLLKQIEWLTELLYSQLGVTKEIMNGTADEATMINYNARTIEVVVNAVVEAMRRTFLTKTARTQGQSVMAFRSPFKLVPLSVLAEIADKFTRNEILSSNEFRQFIGVKPSKDPKADQLRNSNMPDPNAGVAVDTPVDDGTDSVVQTALGDLDGILTDIFNTLGVDENAVT